eukprot:CAMPEP_0179878064 /NCGR_PEP_ID=MMETSP0982-20121206/25115_1 /TAXON_ID=483367 /ORGANISM="non described non described, Strain CCMP 2436" /LENGTH=63 /DNA_ID=CAMNT_0021770687 /DNA_START=526 /DNA_END=714 /DNA_ORIENTATION=+
MPGGGCYTFGERRVRVQVPPAHPQQSAAPERSRERHPAQPLARAAPAGRNGSPTAGARPLRIF